MIKKDKYVYYIIGENRNAGITWYNTKMVYQGNKCWSMNKEEAWLFASLADAQWWTKQYKIKENTLEDIYIIESVLKDVEKIPAK